MTASSDEDAPLIAKKETTKLYTSRNVHTYFPNVETIPRYLPSPTYF